MRRKTFWLSFPFLCLLLFLLGYSQTSQPLTTINKVTFQSSKLNTKIILDADAPLAISKTAYSQENPQTLVINLGKAQMSEALPLYPEDSTFLKNIRLQKAINDELYLLVDLAEPVPYRIQDGAQRAIIELDEIQRREGEYLIDPEAKIELEKIPRTETPLSRVDISEKGDSVHLTASLGRKAITNVFVLENPLRLVIDIFDTVYSNPTLTYPINKLGVEKVKIGQFQLSNPYSITRLVFDLKEPKLYTLSSDQNELVISFIKSQALSLSQTEGGVKTIPAERETTAQEEKKQEPIKTEQAKEITPPAKNASIPPPPAKASDQVVKEEKKEEQKPVSKPIEEIPQEEQFRPKTIHNAQEKYTGEILSLKFRDADLKDVILYLGERAGLNVIFDPEVKGAPVTCNLEDVPWDQALDLLLKNNKLGKTLEGNVLRIAPIDVLMEEEVAQRRLKETQEQAGPVIHKTITLSYAKAKDAFDLLKTKKSARGEIILDDRTNTLIISDVQEKLDIIEKLISVIDTPPLQVAIEARIVEASSSFVRNLGIQWGFAGRVDPFYGNQTILQFPNRIDVNGALIPQGIVTKGLGGPLGGFAINLPAASFSTALGLSFANVLDTFRLDIVLSALETSGEGKIISCPSITTQNNKEAEIVQGRQIPVNTTANFTVTTRFINAALELKATPQITAEGTIIMTLEISNNAVDYAYYVPERHPAPPIITQSARTTVMVPDGGTTVIGGIYRLESDATRAKVPLLHKIPFLGNLFRNSYLNRQNKELLIFITPRIVK